jgi:hypothetical protein
MNKLMNRCFWVMVGAVAYVTLYLINQAIWG